MAGITTTTDMSTVTAREIDFVTRFARNWENLQKILGITRAIRKTPGTRLVSYTASLKGDALETSPAEGADISFTEFEVVENSYYDVSIEKYGKAVSIEAVAKYGAAVAVEKTDDEFLVQLQNKVMSDFYSMLNAGTLVGKAATWLECIALAKGSVLDQFGKMGREVTEVVGFANVVDAYKYMGQNGITVQTAFGMTYVENYMGYKTLFLLPSNLLASGKVIAVPVENIDLYYVDPGDSDFAKLGLQYTTQGETNLIGFHAEGNYKNATGESYALLGMKLWAEYIDGICVMTVGTAADPAVASGSGVGVSDGVTPKKTKS